MSNGSKYIYDAFGEEIEPKKNLGLERIIAILYAIAFFSMANLAVGLANMIFN